MFGGFNTRSNKHSPHPEEPARPRAGVSKDGHNQVTFELLLANIFSASKSPRISASFLALDQPFI
jgi:hypothetical protein